MSVNSKMTAIANAVRDLRGMSGTMGLDAMATNINGAKTAVAAALAALSEKGVEIPAGTKVDGLAALIAAIEAGGGGNGQSITGDITFASDQTYLNTPKLGFGREADILIVLATNVKDLLGDSMNGYCSFVIGGTKIEECNTENNGYTAYRGGYNANTNSFAFKTGGVLYRGYYDQYMISTPKKWKSGVTYRWFAIFI